MKGRGRARRRGAWLCFFRPVGETGSIEGDEAWQAGSKGNSSKLKVRKGIFRAEQGPPSLSRDSQSRLEAYLGRGQDLHGASNSVLAQAAHSAAMERRLKGLSDDQIACSGNGATCTTWHLDSVVTGSSSAPLESGAASSFEGSSPIKASHIHLSTPHEAGGDSAVGLKPTQGGDPVVLLVPGSSSEPQLHAAPGTPSKLLNRVSQSHSPPDDSETSKTHLQDATPTNSDHSQDSLFQLAENSTSALSADATPAAPRIVISSYTHQQSIVPTPLETTFPRHALHPSRSSHSLTSAAESLSLTESSTSIKLEVFAPAHVYHSPLRTIPITLSSCSGDHHTDISISSVDEDTVSLPFTVHQAQQQPQQQRLLHQRSKTMPHTHSNSQDFKHQDEDGLSIRSSHSHITRRHTAIVLLSNSDDENEDENEENEEIKASGPAAETGTSVPSVASSSASTRSRGNRTIRRLSEVFEGHHIPLQKLRRQMGNPESKAITES